MGCGGTPEGEVCSGSVSPAALRFPSPALAAPALPSVLCCPACWCGARRKLVAGLGFLREVPATSNEWHEGHSWYLAQLSRGKGAGSLSRGSACPVPAQGHCGLAEKSGEEAVGLQGIPVQSQSPPRPHHSCPVVSIVSWTELATRKGT